jgi:hypothetical protein
MDGARRKSVLVVEGQTDRAEPMWSALERAGLDVLACPGPCAPEFTCLGGRGKRCALAAAADVVVLDLELAGDVVMMGTPGWELLLYYLGLGKKVVALVGDGDAVRPLPDDEVAVVPRRAPEGGVLAAVRRLAGASPSSEE